MTTIFSVRARPSEIAEIEAKAKARGFPDKVKYLLALAREDAPAAARHKFASDDLIGAFNTGSGPATNANTRRLIPRKLKARHEKNR